MYRPASFDRSCPRRWGTKRTKPWGTKNRAWPLLVPGSSSLPWLKTTAGKGPAPGGRQSQPPRVSGPLVKETRSGSASTGGVVEGTGVADGGADVRGGARASVAGEASHEARATAERARESAR